MRGFDAITFRLELGEGAEGYVVLDSTFQNASSGGLRIGEDITLAEVAALAREMTLKYAFIGRDSGGAKSGIRLAQGTSPEQRARVLAELGRRMGPLLRRGIYSPGTDINCSREDLAILYAAAGMRRSPETDTSLFTAVGAAAAIAACRDSIDRADRPLRVAIEGFGNVGSWLASLLPPSEYAIVGISTVQGAVVRERGFDAEELARGRKEWGAALVERLDGVRGGTETLFSADVDVFVPGARTWTLTPELARVLRARFVVPVANVPFAEGAVDVLEARGVACLPGFVSNSGGVFGSSLFDSGVPLAEVERICREDFRRVVAALLEARARNGVSPMVLAREVALERLERRHDRATRIQPMYRRAAVILVKEHTPRRLYASLRARRFRRNLDELAQLILERGRRVPAILGNTGT